MSLHKFYFIAGAILLSSVGYVHAQTNLGIIGGGTVVGNNGTTGTLPNALTTPVLGVPGTSKGTLGLAGNTSGVVTVAPQAAAGTYNFNLPATAGTAGQPLLSGGGGAAAQSYGTLGIAGGGTNCTVASGTCLDNITGFAGTGFLQRTAPGTYSFGTSAAIGQLCGAQGLSITNTGASPLTQITTTADQLVMNNTTNVPIYRTAASFNLDTTVGTGASTINGMDGEAAPTSGWLYIWAVDNGVTAASLGSTSATAPTMPAGYTYKCRLGAMFLDASQHPLRSQQKGSRTQYKVTAASNTATYPVASSGAVSNPAVAPFAALSIANFVPPTAVSSQFILQNAGTGSQIALSANNATGVWNSTTNPPACATGAVTNASCDLILETAQTVYYASGQPANSLFVTGWKDAVNAN